MKVRHISISAVVDLLT